MKNAFYFTSKPLFVLNYLNLCLYFFGEAEKQLDQKDKVNFRIYDVATRETNSYHTLRSKGNQTMKFGQLIEYNMRNTFLEKSYTKCGGETIPRPFSKISKLSISLDILIV